MSDQGQTSAVEPIVRGLTAAAKSLRLYPPTSPIPRESVEAATEALSSFLSSEGTLTLRVARDGLAWGADTVAPGSPGALELAEALRDHGVADISFDAGVGGDQLLVFLQAVLQRPEDLAGGGGLAGVLASGGARGIRLTQVELHVVDTGTAGLDDEDAQAFLRELAADPDRLSAWLSAAAHGDHAALEDGLADFVGAVGPDGIASLADSLAKAFGSQDSEGKDALLGLAMKVGGTRDVVADALARVAPHDIADSLCGGSYGSNMMAMSNALTRLPLAERMNEVMAQVQEILPEIGTSEKELRFLEHMLEVRTSAKPEASLVEADPTFQQVATAVQVDEKQVAQTREDVARDSRVAEDGAVSTMLKQLDGQKVQSLYKQTLSSLARMVPHLIQEGRLHTAVRIAEDLAQREARAEQPWPELDRDIRAALEKAINKESARTLLRATAEDPSTAPAARVLLRHAGEGAIKAFVEEAFATKPGGIDAAEAIQGRRFVDVLVSYAANVPVQHVAALSKRLGHEPDSRPAQAMQSLVHRADEASRREAAAGLAMAGGPVALKHMTALLDDRSADVVLAAVKGIAKSDAPGAAAALEARLAAIDADGKDFPLAREIVGALARVRDGDATAVLKRLAERKALIKRGHFAELSALAAQALKARAAGGEQR